MSNSYCKIVLCSYILLLTANLIPIVYSKEITMPAIGTFDVTLTPQQDEVSPVGRMLIHKEYHGAIEGVGQGQMISKRTESGNAVYSAIEEFNGSIEGKKGEFTLIHQGAMSVDEQQLSIHILAGSGTNELVGVEGNLVIIQKGKQHHYELTYSLTGSK